jgi:hypothetical protein
MCTATVASRPMTATETTNSITEKPLVRTVFLRALGLELMKKPNRII